MLIDGDLRRPSLHKFFQVSEFDGAGELPDEAAAIGGIWCGKRRQLEFRCFSAGRCRRIRRILLSSEYMRTLLREAAKEYKFVVVDSPPMLNLADSRILSTLVDGVILVVGGGTTPRDMVQRAYLSTVDAGAHVLGATINFADVEKRLLLLGVSPAGRR